MIARRGAEYRETLHYVNCNVCARVNIVCDLASALTIDVEGTTLSV